MSSRHTKVTVLGGGSWGTTVGSLAARNTATTLWLRNPEIAEFINEQHVNPQYLPGQTLPSGLRATTDLHEAVQTADVLVMGVPSQHFRSVLETVGDSIRPAVPVVSLVKGLEAGTRKRMTEVVGEVLPGHPAGVLSGPNIAKEVLQGYAAAATLAMPQHSAAQLLQGLFHTPRFRLYTSEDVIGVECAGALKNIYAIAVGVGVGLGAGDNTQAMVITRSLRELTKLGVAMGGAAATFAGLSGMGDLIATCTSPMSRNRSVGVALGEGKTLAEILAGMTQVAEGVKSAAVVMELAAKYDVQMPIAHEMDAVINGGQPVTRTYRGLLRQLPGHEVRGEAW